MGAVQGVTWLNHLLPHVARARAPRSLSDNNVYFVIFALRTLSTALLSLSLPLLRAENEFRSPRRLAYIEPPPPRENSNYFALLRAEYYYYCLRCVNTSRKTRLWRDECGIDSDNNSSIWIFKYERRKKLMTKKRIFFIIWVPSYTYVYSAPFKGTKTYIFYRNQQIDIDYIQMRKIDLKFSWGRSSSCCWPLPEHKIYIYTVN